MSIKHKFWRFSKDAAYLLNPLACRPVTHVWRNWPIQTTLEVTRRPGWLASYRDDQTWPHYFFGMQPKASGEPSATAVSPPRK